MKRSKSAVGKLAATAVLIAAAALAGIAAGRGALARTPAAGAPTFSPTLLASRFVSRAQTASPGPSGNTNYVVGAKVPDPGKPPASAARPLTKEASGCWPYPASLDAVKADPQNHTVLYEDANVRFLDVHTPPHTINSRHDHQWLSVFLQEEAQPLGQDHGTDGKAAPQGGVVPADAKFPLLNIAGTQSPHAFENIDTFTKHFYRAELKKIPFECPAPNGAMNSYTRERMTTLPEVPAEPDAWKEALDAIITSQQTDRVRFENFDIRFIEVTVPPGKKQTLGEQLYPSVLIFYEPQPRGVETSSDGSATPVDRKFEGAKFPQAIREGKQPPHAFENKDTFAAHYYRVEFKKINYRG